MRLYSETGYFKIQSGIIEGNLSIANIKSRLFFLALLFILCYTNSTGASQLQKFKLQIDRFGPVRVGMTPKEASKKLGMPLTLGRSADEDDAVCHYIYPNGKLKDIGFMVRDGRIARIDVYTNKISSIDEIRIGDSESLIRKIYSGKLKEKIHPYIGKGGKQITANVLPGYAYVFETSGGLITRFRAGKLAAVLLIEGCH